MKHGNALENQTTRRILLIACAAALAMTFTVSRPQPAYADHATPPPVPSLSAPMVSDFCHARL